MRCSLHDIPATPLSVLFFMVCDGFLKHCFKKPKHIHMRTLLLFLLLACSATFAKAQMGIFATFDTLTLTKPDTFYVNYSNPGQDVGFDDGPAHFQCVYDTAFGGNWTSGFAYSNMTDSITAGYLNQYSAITATGASDSQYAVFWKGYSNTNKIVMRANSTWGPMSFSVTNSTYAYRSMLDGDFVAKKFGGPSGNDTDWFKLTVRAYVGGQLVPDSVEFYLADFRFSNNNLDYIVNTWESVELQPLQQFGPIDSLEFDLSSTDNDPQFGMNTPAYFCMDNFGIAIGDKVHSLPTASIARVYPNPATDKLFVELRDKSITTATVYNLNGQMVSNYPVSSDKLEINTANLPAGSYMLVLKGVSGQATVRFVKQ